MDLIENRNKKLNLADLLEARAEYPVIEQAKQEYDEIYCKLQDSINALVEENPYLIDSLEHVLNLPIIAINIVTQQFDQENGNRWADGTYEAFFVNTRKLFEFTLKLLLQYKNDLLNDQYINFNSDVKDLLEYYIVHKDDIGQEFDINDKIAKNRIDYKDSVTGIHIIIESFFKVAKIGEQRKKLSLQYHFGLHREFFYNIYYKVQKQRTGSSNDSGGGSYNRLNYHKPQNEDLYRLSRDYSNLTDNRYEKKDTKTTLNQRFYPEKLKSVSLSEIKSKLTNYKKNLLVKAYSSRIGKQNNKLSSAYYIPQPLNLGNFIKHSLLMKYNETHKESHILEFKDKFILFCILSGSSTFKALEMLLNNSQDITKKSNLIHYKNNIEFAYKLVDIANYTNKRSTKPNVISVQMPENLSRIYSYLKLNIHNFLNYERIIFYLFREVFHDKSYNNIYELSAKKNVTEQFYQFCQEKIIKYNQLEDLEENVQLKKVKDLFEELTLSKTFFDYMHESISKHLQSKVTEYSSQYKNINLKINNLGKVLLYTYNRKSTNKSSLHMQFLKEIEFRDQGSMSYATVSNQLYVESSWLFRFQKLLNIITELDQYTSVVSANPQEQDKETKGSPFYILPGKFKNFFHNLDSIILQYNRNEYIKDSLTMIYLRYAFSILLCTRDNKNSCDLSNVCFDPAIFTVSEKNTDEHSSIRVVPLIPITIKFIELFQKIKLKYKVEKNIPFLINKDGTIVYMVKKLQILNWLVMENSPISIDYDFVKSIPLNVGRHILTSFAIENSFKNDYLSALMDHSSNGTNTQGIYSGMNNKDFLKESAKLLDKIAKIYLPKFPLGIEL
jgi:hypothetical protein